MDKPNIDPIETIEEFVQGLLGGTDVSDKDVKRALKPFKRNIKIAEREIKREEKRNGRLQAKIDIEEDTIDKIKKRAVKAEGECLEDIENLKKKMAINTEEIIDLQEDVASNQVVIDAMMAYQKRLQSEK